MPEVEILQWNGCYDDRWDDLIVPDAFCHPAKMARGLCRRIFDHLFAIGALKRGDSVCDPFGGIGTTGIEAASRVVQAFLCELEPKFVELAKQNFALHENAWRQFGDPLPIIVQGDSRKLRENLWKAGLAESTLHGVDCAATGFRNQSEASPDSRRGSSESAGNSSLAAGSAQSAAPSTAAIVSSPPYNLPMSQDHNGSRGGQRGTEPSEHGAFVKYGSTPGQLEGMSMGDIDAVVCSPPFSDPGSQPAGSMPSTPVRSKQKAMGLEKKAGEEYGATPGQLGQLKVGDVEAVICSPPFSDRQPAAHARPSEDVKLSTIEADTYGQTDGQLGTMPIGELAAVVTSPPYSNNTVHGESGIDQSKLSGNTTGKNSQARKMDGYGEQPGNLGGMPEGTVASIVSSPPYSECLQGDNTARETAEESRSKRVTEGGSLGQSCRHAGYGSAENLGNLPIGSVDALAHSRMTAHALNELQRRSEEPETFWSAARDIVRESFLILKPGGWSAWVVKAFVRDGVVVDFPGDWCKLLESQGFVVTTRIHAMLVKHETQPGLFGEDVTKTTKRASFFRRLYEKKNPQNSIDYEEVVLARKP